jgi:hypothetical protein
MNEPVAVDTKAKKSPLSNLAWWKADPAEVEKQVLQYETLGFWKSARRLSAFLCGLSVVATVLLGAIMKTSTDAIAVEAVLWSTLGYFMYRGHRWAFVAGMVTWTIEKAFLLVTGVAGGAAPVVQAIWWAIYMNAFFLGFKVERERARRSTLSVQNTNALP